VSLFASAYDSVTDDAEAAFLAFFASKTISMIRAPDEFVYPPPFNLIEIFLVAPFEPILPRKLYVKLNEKIMIVILFIPLSIIALLESTHSKPSYFRDWFDPASSEVDTSEEAQNPQVEEGHLKISKVPFKELIKVFPSSNRLLHEEMVLQELRELRKKVDDLTTKLNG